MDLALDAASLRTQLQPLVPQGGRIVDAADLAPEAAVPASWRQVLARHSPDRAPLPSGWAVVRPQLPAVSGFLATALRCMVLLQEADGTYSLLYVYTAGASGIGCYRGRPPVVEVPRRFASVWHRLPSRFREFYTRVHDGWTFLPAKSMRPLPIDDWAWLSDYRFDIDERKAGSLPVNIDDVLAVFHNGAGDYLCLHFPATGGAQPSGMIWWHEHPDTLEPVDFWGVLDAWIGIFVEDADPVMRVS